MYEKNSAYRAIEECYRFIRERHICADVPPTNYSDKETFDLINSPDIGYVFFPEGVGEKIKDEIKKYKPYTIEGLTTLLLFHSEGDDLSVFFNAYEDKTVGEILLPYLQDTNGLLLWEEQLTEILSSACGFSYDEITGYRAQNLGRSFLGAPDYRSLSLRNLRSVYDEETARYLCEKLWIYGQRTVLKEKMLESAKTCYIRAYLKTHYREEFDEIFINGGINILLKTLSKEPEDTLGERIPDGRIYEPELSYNILRGENKIGENLIEIMGYGKRILLECGKALFPDESTETVEKYVKNEAYDAVFISHTHEDHCGLLKTPIAAKRIFMGEWAFSILQEKDAICRENAEKVTTIKSEEEFFIGVIRFVPHLCDHSSADSYMIEISDNSKTILYTGDFRSNGRKNYDKLLNNLPEKVDVLICERTIDADKNETEWDLEEKAVEIMRKHNEVFILQSAENADRTVSFYRACKRTNTPLFMPPIFAQITRHKENIPNPKEYADCFLYLARNTTQEVRDSLKERYKNKLIGREQIAKTDKFAIMITSGMLDYITKLLSLRPLSNAVLIYSLWNGYKENMADFLNGVEKSGVSVVDLHVSGHADKEAIDALIKRTNPDEIRFVHTDKK